MPDSSDDSPWLDFAPASQPPQPAPAASPVGEGASFQSPDAMSPLTVTGAPAAPIAPPPSPAPTVVSTDDAPWADYASPATPAVPTPTAAAASLDAPAASAGALPASPAIAAQQGSMGAFGNVDAAVRGAARAIPFMDDVAAAGNTALSYLPSGLKAYVPGTNPQDQTGEAFGQRYSENLARERGIDAFDDTNRPVASYGGQLAGALGLPIGPAGALSSAAGRVVGPKLGAAIGSGIAGAGYGALYGAGQGTSVSDRLQQAKQGAIFGGVAGTVAPAIVKGVSQVGSALAAPFKMALNPEGVAAKRIASKLAQDAGSGMSSADIKASAAAGQPTVLADVGGEATRGLARSSANLSPEARSALTEATSSRFASQNTRFSGFMKGLFGNDLNNQAVRDDLASRAKAINGPAYKAAYAKGANGVWDDDFAALVRAPDMQSAIQDATRKGANDAVLNGNQVVKNPFTKDADGNVALAKGADGQQATPTLQFWDHVKRSLDDKISVARRSGANDDARQIGDLKNVLVAKLDEAVPEYANARQGAFKAFGAENALEAGEKFLGMSKAADIDAVRKSFAQMDGPQREFFAQGLASQISQKAENASERRNIIGLFNSPQTAEKMRLGLGEGRSNQIEAYLRRESMADRLRTALGNSTTARQTAEIGEAQGHGGGGHGIMGMVTGSLSSPAAGAVAGAVGAYHEHGFDPEEMAKYAAGGAMAGMMGKFVKNTNHGVVSRIGEMLASDDPHVIARVTKQVARNPDLMQGLRRAEVALSGTSAQFGSSQPAPSRLQLPAPVRAAGGRVEPTDAQKEAGNYRKDHIRLAGMDIAIENRKGTQRSGVSKSGHRWFVTMPAHYGYIKGTTGADGDHVDCYIGPDVHASDAFIVDQVELPGRSFDEQKVMLGFANEREAMATYIKGFSDGKGSQRIGKVTRIPVSQVHAWARSSAARRPMRARGGQVPSIDPDEDIRRALSIASKSSDTQKPARARGGGLLGMGKGVGPLGVPTFGQMLGPGVKAAKAPFASGGVVSKEHPEETAARFMKDLQAMSVAMKRGKQERAILAGLGHDPVADALRIASGGR